jgi:very-short-patch-repair endonuclease
MLDDAWRAVCELAASQHGVFTRGQAASAGLNRRRLLTAIQEGRIEQVTPTVYVIVGSVATYRRRVMVATLASCGAVASHRTAALLHALDGVRSQRIDVSCLASERWRATLDRVEIHRAATLPARDLVTVDGIRCTSVPRTLADLGSVVSSDTVMKALIGAHARRVSLTPIREAALRLHRPGQSGTRVLLRHLDTLSRAGTVPESWFEEVLRRILVDRRLPRLESQYVLRDRQGRFVARFDHAFPSVRLAVEAHSRRFHFGPVAEAKDEDRDFRVAKQGWEVVYLGWYSKDRPQAVVESLLEVVQHRRAA